MLRAKFCHYCCQRLYVLSFWCKIVHFVDPWMYRLDIVNICWEKFKRSPSLLNPFQQMKAQLSPTAESLSSQLTDEDFNCQQRLRDENHTAELPSNISSLRYHLSVTLFLITSPREHTKGGSREKTCSCWAGKMTAWIKNWFTENVDESL